MAFQQLGRDELGLPDDPVQRGMLGGEVEEAAKAAAFGLDPVARAARAVGHGLADAVVEVEQDLLEHRLFGREIQVEGALCETRRLGDLHDRRGVETVFGEDLFRRVQDALPAAVALTRPRAPTWRHFGVRHAVMITDRASYARIHDPYRRRRARKLAGGGCLEERDAGPTVSAVRSWLGCGRSVSRDENQAGNRRGFGDEEVVGIMGENFLRTFAEPWR